MHINMLHFAFIFGGSIQHAYRNRKRIVATIMNETAVLAIVRKVNEEIKEELRIEFSERIAGLLETVRKQQTQINEQQHQIDAVKAFYEGSLIRALLTSRPTNLPVQEAKQTWTQ